METLQEIMDYFLECLKCKTKNSQFELFCTKCGESLKGIKPKK